MSRPPHFKRPAALGALAMVLLGLAVMAVVLVLPTGSGAAATDVHPATAGAPVALAGGHLDESGSLTARSLLADPNFAAIVALYAAKADADRQIAAYLQAVAQQQAAEAAQAAAQRQQAAAAQQSNARRSSGATSYGGSGACGGDLPPCCVMMRESHGSPTAVNSSSGASGKWQFMPGTWNNYMGYPTAASAPASVQDQRARQVYAGGAGASNWAGPGC